MRFIVFDGEGNTSTLRILQVGRDYASPRDTFERTTGVLHLASCPTVWVVQNGPYKSHDQKMNKRESDWI